jgi:ATP-dependent DNA helicase RecQ
LTSDAYKLLRSVLDGQRPEGRSKDHLAARLDQMSRGSHGKAWGDGDAVSVLAQFMRREMAISGSRSIREVLQGPLAAVSLASLQRCHLDVIARESDRLVIEAKEWTPKWLDGAVECSITTAPLAGEMRRAFEACSPDPFLRRLGLKAYRCAGQREAVRAALTMPEGATLLVNLPTGAGKSLLAQLPCVLDRDGLTVVVVPTTSLCIDQERALRDATRRTSDAIEHETAFYAGKDERRDRICHRLRRGEQRIVFASPEAVCGRLSHLLHAAAQRNDSGRLRWLIIDEAHMVDQWGGSFRTEFQGLAGLRSALVRAGGQAPLRTLLLSATLTPTCIVGLQRLFDKPGPFQAVHAVQLRPEPSCWFALCDNAKQQRARVEEAVFNLPRPLILYTTKIKDAQQWQQNLRSLGILRTGLVIGPTRASERARVMTDLRRCKLEVVVANAAFGLGVDAEVRSIVHACVPENLDRYYQEIGRGGRDGQASISMVLYTHDDLQCAEQMNRQAVIGRDRGLDRWKQLFSLKTDLGDGVYCVRLNTRHRRNERHLQWDNHTLNLLARAGVLSLDWENVQFPGDDASLEERKKFQDELRRRRLVRVLDNAPLDESTWDTKVEPERHRVSAACRRGFKLMDEALRGVRCLADIAADLYGAPQSDELPGGAIRVAKSCGGCPACRRAGHQPWANAMPVPPQPWPVNRRGMTDALARLLQHGSVAVFYSAGDAAPGWKGLADTLTWMVRAGLRFVAAPADLLQVWTPPDLQQPVFVSEGWPLSDPASVPALVVHPQGEVAPSDLYGFVGLNSRPGVLLFEEQTLTQTGRRLRDIIRMPAFSFSELQEGWMG